VLNEKVHVLVFINYYEYIVYEISKTINDIEAYKGVYVQDMLKYIQDIFVAILGYIFVDFARSYVLGTVR